MLFQGLIDRAGSPIGLAGLITHLFYTAPANFALLSCLRQGVFHRILARHGVRHGPQSELIVFIGLLLCCLMEASICLGFEWPVRVLEEMMLVVSYLFNRTRLHPFVKKKHDASRHRTGSVVRFSLSHVLYPLSVRQCLSLSTVVYVCMQVPLYLPMHIVHVQVYVTRQTSATGY